MDARYGIRDGRWSSPLSGGHVWWADLAFPVLPVLNMQRMLRVSLVFGRDIHAVQEDVQSRA